MSASSGSGRPRRTTTNYSTTIKQILRKQTNPIQRKENYLGKKRKTQNNQETIEQTEEMQEIEDNTNDTTETQPIILIDNNNRTSNKGKEKADDTQQGSSTIEPILENNPTGGNLGESDWTYVTNKRNNNRKTTGISNPIVI